MNRSWTPKSRVSVTDAGMVIKVDLAGVPAGAFRTTFEDEQLCLRGQHDDFGSFEIKFEIPQDFSRLSLKFTMVKNILRIELPRGADKPFLSDFPKNMLIYCDGCGKHFDIVIASKGPADYPCPACGKIQTFDLEALVNKVIALSKNMVRKKRGRQ